MAGHSLITRAQLTNERFGEARVTQKGLAKFFREMKVVKKKVRLSYAGEATCLLPEVPLVRQTLGDLRRQGCRVVFVDEATFTGKTISDRTY